MTADESRLAQCSAFLRGKCASIVAAPISFGQSLAGVVKAPEAMKNVGLENVIQNLGWAVTGWVFIDAKPSEDIEVMSRSSTTYYTEEELPRGRELGVTLKKVYAAVKERALRGDFIVTLGGDHSIAAATIGAMLKVHENLCVVWVDAHADANTPETSTSRRYHGMPVAHLFQDKFEKKVPGFDWLLESPRLQEDRIGYIGLRQVDEDERRLILKHNIMAKAMSDVDEFDIAKCVVSVLKAIDFDDNRPIHLSFDIDACDPSIAPGTGTKARGGLTYREAHYICEALSKTGRLVSMDMVEVNPDIDSPDEKMQGDDVNIDAIATKTVRLAIELIASALGKSILY